jgi:membrane associated rhomboid family serine protease
MQQIHVATIAIILINVLFSLKGFNDFTFFEKYKFNVAGILRGEQIRMFTSGFLHVDFNHLLFNMLTLYFFADVVINDGDVGVGKFVLIYVAGLIVGNLLSLYFHKNEYHYSAVGASGAVMGIIYSAILISPDSTIYFMPAWLFGLLYLFYTLYGMRKRAGNIGHDAHFGGAIAGYVTTIAFKPSLIEHSLWLVGVLAIPIVVLFVLYKLGKI